MPSSDHDSPLNTNSVLIFSIICHYCYFNWNCQFGTALALCYIFRNLPGIISGLWFGLLVVLIQFILKCNMMVVSMPLDIK